MQALKLAHSKHNSSVSNSGNPEFHKKASADLTFGSSRISVPRVDNRLSGTTDSMRIVKRLQTRSGVKPEQHLTKRQNSVSINHLPSSKVVLWNRFLLADRRKPAVVQPSYSSQESGVLLYEPLAAPRAALGPCSAEVTEKRESSRQIFKPPGDHGENSPGAELKNQLAYERMASGRSEFMSKATMEGILSQISPAVAPSQSFSLKASVFRRNSGQSEQGLRLVSSPVTKKSQFNPKLGAEKV